MKITDVELYSNNINFLTFSVRKPEPGSNFFVRDMVGLDADEVTPSFYGFGLETNQKYMDFSMKPREIVMRIILNPKFNLGEDYADVRDGLYKAISSSRIGLIDLHFNDTGTTVGRISAYITKFETVHFTQNPEVQLTFQCNDPFFKSVDSIIYEHADLNPGGSDPLENPILISDGLSTAPHGFRLQATFLSTTSTFTIQDALADYEWRFAIFPNGGFLASDVLYMSSERGNKYLYMTRGATVIHLMDKIDTKSLWPILFPGQNVFYIPEIVHVAINNVEYYANYWGV